MLLESKEKTLSSNSSTNEDIILILVNSKCIILIVGNTQTIHFSKRKAILRAVSVRSYFSNGSELSSLCTSRLQSSHFSGLDSGVSNMAFKKTQQIHLAQICSGEN